MSGRVAQLVEQRPFKAWVAGSNPAALTIRINSLAEKTQTASTQGFSRRSVVLAHFCFLPET
jgi:hypothetical protein